MRLAIIARGCRPGAGIELYTHELVKHLHTRHEIHLLTDPREVTACPATIVPVSILSRPLWYSIRAFSTRAGFLAQHQDYDIVHTQGSDGSWGDVVTAHSCHQSGMRASLKLHPTWMNWLRKCISPAHRAVIAQERSAYNSARVIVAVSKRVRRQIQAAYAVARQIPIQVIYPGVDTQAFSPTQAAKLRMSSRKKYGFSPDQVVFALVANSLRLKGADRLIHALAELNSPRAQLLIATGRQRFADLQRLARSLKISGQVHWVKENHAALSVYAAADVYTALPEYESFGLTILEAMACGVPILVTRNAGVAELMTPGQEGFLLPTLVDKKTVAQAMEYLLQDDEVRVRMGHAARLTAEKYTWDRTAREIEKVYEQILKQKKSDAKK